MFCYRLSHSAPNSLATSKCSLFSELLLFPHVFARSCVACLFNPPPCSSCQLQNQIFLSKDPFYHPSSCCCKSNGGFAIAMFKGFVKYDVSLKRGLFGRGNEFQTWNNNVTWHNATCQVGEQKHFQFAKLRLVGISKQ